MISDQLYLHQTQDSWKAVRSAQARVETNTFTAFMGGGVLTPDFIDFNYCLVLVFAYSVLDDVLEQLRDEGKFQSGRSNLKSLMDASRSNLAWVDFTQVNEGRENRNLVAHQLTILPRGVV